MDLSFEVHKLSKFSENPCKVHFEGLVHLLRYIRYNATLGLKCYADLNDALVSEILRQFSIKTENQLVAFSDYKWKVCSDTGRSTGAYIIFYQGGTIYHVTNVPIPVSQSSVESEYNVAWPAEMALAHFRVLIHELFNKDPNIVPEEVPLILLYSKYVLCMAKNSKDTKHTKHISRGIHFLRYGEKCKMRNIYWCEGVLQ